MKCSWKGIVIFFFKKRSFVSQTWWNLYRPPRTAVDTTVELAILSVCVAARVVQVYKAVGLLYFGVKYIVRSCVQGIHKRMVRFQKLTRNKFVLCILCIFNWLCIPWRLCNTRWLPRIYKKDTCYTYTGWFRKEIIVLGGDIIGHCEKKVQMWFWMVREIVLFEFTDKKNLRIKIIKRNYLLGI